MKTSTLLCIGTLLASILAPFAVAKPGVGVERDLPTVCSGPGADVGQSGLRVVLAQDCSSVYVEYRTNAVDPRCAEFDSARDLPPFLAGVRVRTYWDCFVLVNA